MNLRLADFAIILNQSNRIVTAFLFCFGNNQVSVKVQKMQEKPPFSSYFDFFSNVWEGISPSHAHPLRTFNLPSDTPPEL